MTSVGRVLREKRRIVTPLTVALAVNAGIFLLAVVPLGRRVQGATVRAEAATARLRDAQTRHAAAEATLSGKSRADVELRRFYREVLPPDWTAARRITYARLVQLAGEFNLRPARTGAEPQANRESALTRLQMTMVLSGAYADIRAFIHALEKASEFVVIENVALAQGDTANAPLTLTLEVATYYWAGDDGR